MKQHIFTLNNEQICIESLLYSIVEDTKVQDLTVKQNIQDQKINSSLMGQQHEDCRYYLEHEEDKFKQNENKYYHFLLYSTFDQNKLNNKNRYLYKYQSIKQECQSKIYMKWTKNIHYELIKERNNSILFRIQKNRLGVYDYQEIKQGVLNQNRIINRNQLKKTIIQKEQDVQNDNNQLRLLGGGQCGGKQSSKKQQNDQQQQQKIIMEKKQSILVTEFNNRKQPEKNIENYTYQMNEEQLEKIKVILQKLHFQYPSEEIPSRYVSSLFLSISEVFSSVLSRGITNTQTLQLFQQLLEGGVNFLLSLIFTAEKQKLVLFDERMKEKVLEKINKTYKLFKQYENRLPLQVGIFLLRYQKKIIKLQRKQKQDSPQNKALKFDAKGWNQQYIRFCFGGFEDVDFNHLSNLISSLSIYYEFSKQQKFVVDLLKTEFTIIKKYSDVLQKKVQFEEYFEGILKDYESNKSYSSIFYTHLMLFDQIFENHKNLSEVEAGDPKKEMYSELAIHFIKLVSGEAFIELCRKTFYLENLKIEASRKGFIKQLSENFSLRYIELKILVYTYKLIKVFETKNNLSDAFTGAELKNIEILEINIFEKFLQESSCEVNCLIYDDEQMLKLIEILNIRLDNIYYTLFRHKLRAYKQNLEKLIIDHIENNEELQHQQQEKENHMIDQLLGRKITYSIAINDPNTAISNRFVEALINRISSKSKQILSFLN